MKLLQGVGFDRMVGATNDTDCTLLYGYDTDRRTWHVYQKGGWLYRVIYIGTNPDLVSADTAERMDARALIPNKRLYPEACDFVFCFELAKREIALPFTTYGTMRTDPNQQFIGRIL
jgi:hypothetical protein